MTISEKQNEYGAKVAHALVKANIRAKTDFSDNTIGKKIRNHRKMRPAYMLIIGEEEAAEGTVAIRARNGDQRNKVKIDNFIEEIVKEIKERDKNLKLISS